jgi:hypothetical protein
MRYTRPKSCPHCSFVYTKYSSLVKQMGSSIRTCERCKRTFIDADRFMPPFQPWHLNRPYRLRVFAQSSIAVSSVALFFAVNLNYLIAWGIFVALASVTLIVTVLEIRSYNERIEAWKTDLRETGKQAADPRMGAMSAEIYIRHCKPGI